MPVSKALRRLLHVRDVEEEQHRLRLESALSELLVLQRARLSANSRARGGRALLVAAVRAAEITDRTAALVECQAGIQCASALALTISVAESNVLHLRETYLQKRLERRQAQTLVEEADVQEAVESGRRGQQVLDAAYGTRKYREQREAGKR